MSGPLRARALPAHSCCQGEAGRSAPKARDDRRKGDEVPLRVRTKSPSELFEEVRARVDGLTLHQNFVVQVRTGRTAAVAGEPERRPGNDALTDGDADLREVAVHALDVVAVIDRHRVPVFRLPAGEADAAARRGADRRAALGTNVHAGVELLVTRPR